MLNKYHTEENFGGKKLWQMDFTAELVKTFGEWTELADSFLASMPQQSMRWRHGTIKTRAV